MPKIFVNLLTDETCYNSRYIGELKLYVLTRRGSKFQWIKTTLFKQSGKLNVFLNVVLALNFGGEADGGGDSEPWKITLEENF